MESLLFPWLQKVTSWGKDDVSKRCGQELREGCSHYVETSYVYVPST